jgi:hypothetical protein
LITKQLYDVLKKRKDYAPAKVIFNGDEPGFNRTELNKVIQKKTRFRKRNTKTNNINIRKSLQFFKCS